MDFTIKDKFSDYEIRIGDKIFYTHKIILSINSEYFAGLLNSNLAKSQDYTVLDKEFLETIPIILTTFYRQTKIDSESCDLFLLVKHCKYLGRDSLALQLIPLLQLQSSANELVKFLMEISFLEGINHMRVDKFVKDNIPLTSDAEPGRYKFYVAPEEINNIPFNLIDQVLGNERIRNSSYEDICTLFNIVNVWTKYHKDKALELASKCIKFLSKYSKESKYKTILLKNIMAIYFNKLEISGEDFLKIYDTILKL